MGEHCVLKDYAYNTGVRVQYLEVARRLQKRGRIGCTNPDNVSRIATSTTEVAEPSVGVGPRTIFHRFASDLAPALDPRGGGQEKQHDLIVTGMDENLLLSPAARGDEMKPRASTPIVQTIGQTRKDGRRQL